jgi:hypothetical protein
MSDFSLTRNAFGRLVFESAEVGKHEGVVPVRAFPIAAPDEGLSLVNAEGRELAWIPSLSTLPAELRVLVEDELASREFLPQIARIVHVSSFATPSTWDVETDRGTARLVLKGEEDIRRVAQSSLLIADSHGVQYLIKDLTALDKHSRKILDRFL